MDIPNRGRIVAALVAALAASQGAAQTSPSPGSGLRYRTACRVDGGFLDGYVSNEGQDPYQVDGAVAFRISAPNSISRPMVGGQSDAVVAPGTTERVAHVPLTLQLQAGEGCSFDASAAIRRLPQR